jgi:hypothetical protein
MKQMVLLALFLILIVCATAYAYDDRDFQIWNTNAQDFKINEDLRLTLEEEFRWADNANEFFYHHYDVGIFYSFSKFINLAAGYRHIYGLNNGKFKLENDPYLIATLSWQEQGFVLGSRNRLEYRHFEYQGDSWRYRNKFTLKLPWKFSKIQIQPYLADEIFIAFGNSQEEFNQNRVASGFSMKLSEQIKAELYYMLVSTKKPDEWSDANVLGIKMKVSF